MSDASSHQPMEQAPKDGTIILVQQEVAYRWASYKPAAPQFKQGIAGRWQRFNGYGWENEILSGSGWRPAPSGESAPK